MGQILLAKGFSPLLNKEKVYSFGGIFATKCKNRDRTIQREIPNSLYIRNLRYFGQNMQSMFKPAGITILSVSMTMLFLLSFAGSPESKGLSEKCCCPAQRQKGHPDCGSNFCHNIHPYWLSDFSRPL